MAFTSWNPITDVESLFGGGKKKSPKPADTSGLPGYGSQSAPTYQHPLDQISAFVQQYVTPSGTTPDPQQLYSYFKALGGKSLASQDALQKELVTTAQAAQWQPKAAGGGALGTTGTSASAIDPLAIQMFFQNTIAPYLNQVGAGETQTANMLRNQDTSKLPPAYRSIVQAGNQAQATDMDMLQQATTAASLQQPRIDQLNQLLGLIQQQKLRDYYAQLKASSAAAPTPFPTS